MTFTIRNRCIAFFFCTLLTFSCVHKEAIPQTPLNWREPGVEIPDVQQIAELRTRCQTDPSGLSAELRDPDILVRRRAAYLAECVGPAAPALSESLFAALHEEEDELNRVYLVRAIATVAPESQETLEVLRTEFGSESNAIVRTYLAGAIMNVDGLRDSEAELQFLLDSLNPARVEHAIQSDDIPISIWEQQWAAAYMIAKLGPQAGALTPAMEHLTEIEIAPEWVSSQIWFTLQAISPRRVRQR